MMFKRKLLWLFGGTVMIGSLGYFIMAAWGQMDRHLRVEFLRTASFPIRTIDPTDEEFEDLEPLVKIIGDRRFVFMGENSHYDGATFDARTRLIRFLHQKMGFDVVIVETYSYVRAADLDRALTTKESYVAYARRNPTDRNLITQRPLLDYIHSTRNLGDSPIALMGCHVYYNSDTDLVTQLRKSFADMSPPPLSPLQVDRIGTILRPLTPGDSWPTQPPSPEEIVELEQLTDVVIKHIEDHREAILKSNMPAKDLDLLDNLLRSLPAFARSTTMGSPHHFERDRSQLAQRDKAMADLVIRSVNAIYQGRKAIILAANSHLLRRAGKFEPMKGIDSMGEHLYRALGEENIYTIVFDTYDGQNGLSPPIPLMTASPRTLAGLFHQVQDPYRFLDLRSLTAGHWLRREEIGVHATAYVPDGNSAIWPQVCDGIFYIDEMTPVRLPAVGVGE